MRPLLAVGPSVARDARLVGGQAMIFQLIVDTLSERGTPLRVFDTSERNKSARRIDGGISLPRIREYISVLSRVWLAMLGRRQTVYLTTAQSLVGFLRDAAIIWPAHLLGHVMVAHQLGGKYLAFYNSQNRVVKKLIRLTMSRVSAIVVEAECLRRSYSFLPDWEQKVHEIANGLADRDIKPRREPKRYDASQPFSMLYVSQMVESKGCWDVLEAVRILKNERHRNVRCRFVGQWVSAADSVRFPDEELARREFFAKIERYRLTDSVTHEDLLLGKEKAEAFENAHAFVLPSNYANEGQPVSVLEAMASATVVIATRYRLIPMMVEENETGCFVEHGAPEDIADRVEFFMDHPDEFERMSAGSIQRFQEQFTTDKYLNRVQTLLDSL